MSVAVTHGVRVEVKSRYVPEESSPTDDHYFFAYTVHISNVGDTTVQLISRHWVITDDGGHIQEVRGPGVVGKQPVLEPGASFEYTSACPLPTPHGVMHGTYQMVDKDGASFDAEIAPFELQGPTPFRSRGYN